MLPIAYSPIVIPMAMAAALQGYPCWDTGDALTEHDPFTRRLQHDLAAAAEPGSDILLRAGECKVSTHNDDIRSVSLQCVSCPCISRSNC